ncbi:hypothetical protein ONS95_004364 [Cadophora gregata]|uniref:uncharacterized protein n=1 Tax=Cadophora gregata TaxID=51156 RepID=UPI0026DADEE2|nr:uncharacterized protein ONS95_004364 [Cadophora gregata]KAK0105247.1 hypothetical protein ONS96_004644 [Cadophora gregata f. sp. sojae]KAK0105850.1 hypothetical protein ONS95_004364 [Cadophora gregata]
MPNLLQSPVHLLDIAIYLIAHEQIAFVSCSPTPSTTPTTTSKRDGASHQFKAQFRNPSEIFSVLLLIGGDTIQKAVAQMTGRKVTLVAFSFGWVAHSFSALVAAFGDGALMPKPDVSASVIVVSSRNKKSNSSWVLGRLVRDLERIVDEKMEPWERDSGLIVSVFDAIEGGKQPTTDVCFYSFFICCFIQLFIAAVPIVLHRDWSIVLITLVGTILSICTGSLRKWREEKYSCREGSKESYILTRGNGHRHVFIVRGNERGLGLALDDLAGAVVQTCRRTRLACGLSAFLWFAFLVTAGGLDGNKWCLLGVGTVGMIQNVFVAGRRRSPHSHGIPLSELHESILGKVTVRDRRPKVMDVLFQVEEKYPGIGLAIRPEFFEDCSLREEEIKTWAAHERKLEDIKAKEKFEREASRGNLAGSIG